MNGRWVEPAIPFNALINRLKNQHRNDFMLHHSTAAELSQPGDYIDSVIDKGVTAAGEKLAHYLEMGRITGEEESAFLKMIADIAEDLRDGGISRGLYGYFENHFDYSKDVFNSKYHNIADYLVRVLKSSIEKQLTEDRN